jgi:acyl-CoA reductase-like NAD-dependent aldehyde dehydrogenase
MTIKSINPHRPSDVVVEAEPSGPDGVKSAVARAREAFGPWAAKPNLARGEALAAIAEDLERNGDRLTELIVREVGKPIAETKAEIARAIAIFRYHSQMVLVPDGDTYPSPDAASWLVARRFPRGVCGLLTPWNFPVAIPAWKLAPAIGSGNTAVLKPAPQATATAQMLHRIASEHVPEGVFELVAGDGETGAPLVEHPDVAAVSFTGSVPVGHEVARAAAARGAHVQCEMGGQNPSIVLADADLDKAASAISFAAMGYAGQKCTATSRVIAEEGVYDRFRDKLIAAIEEMKVLDPENVSCKVGPVI